MAAHTRESKKRLAVKLSREMEEDTAPDMYIVTQNVKREYMGSLMAEGFDGTTKRVVNFVKSEDSAINKKFREEILDTKSLRPGHYSVVGKKKKEMFELTARRAASMGIEGLKEHEVLNVKLDEFVPLVQEVNLALREGGGASLVDEEAENSKGATSEEPVDLESPAASPKTVEELKAEFAAVREVSARREEEFRKAAIQASAVASRLAETEEEAARLKRDSVGDDLP